MANYGGYGRQYLILNLVRRSSNTWVDLKQLLMPIHAFIGSHDRHGSKRLRGPHNRRWARREGTGRTLCLTFPPRHRTPRLTGRPGFPPGARVGAHPMYEPTGPCPSMGDKYTDFSSR
eukprot:scaffold85_cov358-Pavlova_lutheri.AAC.35